MLDARQNHHNFSDALDQVLDLNQYHLNVETKQDSTIFQQFTTVPEIKSWLTEMIQYHVKQDLEPTFTILQNRRAVGFNNDPLISHPLKTKKQRNQFYTQFKAHYQKYLATKVPNFHTETMIAAIRDENSNNVTNNFPVQTQLDIMSLLIEYQVQNYRPENLLFTITETDNQHLIMHNLFQQV